jgi:hypothetical protein
VAIGINLRNILSGAILALAMALALVVVSDGAHANTTSSAASEGVHVCNTASANGTGGDLEVLSEDPQAPVNNATGLREKRNGNYNAAMHSRALAICGTPAVFEGGGS